MARCFAALAVFGTTARAAVSDLPVAELDLEGGVLRPTTPPTPYPVVEMDLYGGVPRHESRPYGIENANLMSLMGVLKYIHTDVIPEHEASPEDRLLRKNEVEVITRSRFKIKNPPSVVADPGYPETLVSDVDFGPYMHYQDGRVTSTFQVGLIQRHGDIVGVQEIRDERFLARDPFYWFSFSGWCPNIPDSKKPSREWLANDANRELCQNRSKTECGELNSTCSWTWSGNWETSCNIGADVIPQCANYTNGTGFGDKVKGGLCPGGANTLSVTPTGEYGCTYSYGPSQSVDLDRLTGILEEDCGGRKCSDWADFRQHCTNEKYKQKFEGDVSAKGAKPVSYCVEYDIHQACASSCTSKACKKLPEDQREVGLPFWRGRCDAKANLERAEKLARAFGIDGKHQLVSKDLQPQQLTCVHRSPGFCTPGPGQGGMYCARNWGSVCQPCYIPGTVEPYQATGTPTCPYGVLNLTDYKGKYPLPKCRSDKARDLCCLYTGRCENMTTDVSLLPADDNGYALAAFAQSTNTMAAFLEMAAAKNGRIRSGSNLLNFAYYEWGSSPVVGRNLKAVFADMTGQGHLLKDVPTTTTLQSTTSTTPATPAVVADRPVVASGAMVTQAPKMPWWGWMLLVLSVSALAMGAAVALTYHCLHQGPKVKVVKRKPRSKRGAEVDPEEQGALLPEAAQATEVPANPLMSAAIYTPAMVAALPSSVFVATASYVVAPQTPSFVVAPGQAARTAMYSVASTRLM